MQRLGNGKLCRTEEPCVWTAHDARNVSPVIEKLTESRFFG